MQQLAPFGNGVKPLEVVGLEHIAARGVMPDIHLSWSAALEAEKAVRQIGFMNTQVLPLLNGWELDKKSAAQHLHEYPELRYFIARE